MISKREWDVLDRFTRMDDKLELMAKTLEQIKDLLAGVRPAVPVPIPRVEIPKIEVPRIGKVEVERLEEIIEILASYTQFFEFTYPADATSAKVVSAGTTVIDFYEGVVRLPDGTSENLSDYLRIHGLTHVQSLMLEVDKNARYKIDDRGYKPIYAYDPQFEEHQRFTRVTLTTSESTAFTIWASTNPAGVSRKIGASIINLKGTKETPTTVTVGTTATQLIDSSSRIAVMIANAGANTVYLGNSSVTSSNGIPLAAGRILIDTITRDEWYAITASATSDVRVEKIVRGGVWAR